MEDVTPAERRQIEVELLQAMYPDQIRYDYRTCELKYTSTSAGTIVLRLPEQYPAQGLPDVISATDSAKSDVRARTKAVVLELDLAEGEEMLDAVIQGFETISGASTDMRVTDPGKEEEEDARICKQKTVVIWLHHLLNTNKRKLALGPTQSAATDIPGGSISGITKPGYPGILVYSGPEALVVAHVTELRQQKWQAFQVRYEEVFEKGNEWLFEHGEEIREVESMSDVVHDIVGEEHRNLFLKATGVK